LLARDAETGFTASLGFVPSLPWQASARWF
jgi:hypothetical protein